MFLSNRFPRQVRSLPFFLLLLLTLGQSTRGSAQSHLELTPTIIDLDTTPIVMGDLFRASGVTTGVYLNYVNFRQGEMNRRYFADGELLRWVRDIPEFLTIRPLPFGTESYYQLQTDGVTNLVFRNDQSGEDRTVFSSSLNTRVNTHDGVLWVVNNELVTKIDNPEADGEVIALDAGSAPRRRRFLPDGRIVLSSFEGMVISDGTEEGTLRFSGDFSTIVLAGEEIIGKSVDKGVFRFSDANGLETSRIDTAFQRVSGLYPAREGALWPVDYNFDENPETVDSLDIWVTDGTAEGSVARQLFPADSAVRLIDLREVAGILLLELSLDNQPATLWQTDGTEAGTFQLQRPDDLALNQPLLSENIVVFDAADGTSYLRVNLSPVESYLYGQASNDPFGVFNYFGPAPEGLNFNNTNGVKATIDQFIYQPDNDGNAIYELSPTGVSIITSQESGGPIIRIFSAVDGVLYFSMSYVSPNSGGLVEAGLQTFNPATREVGVVELPFDPDNRAFFTNVSAAFALRDSVFFHAEDNLRGLSLYRTDGTTAGTAFVQRLFENNEGSNMEELTAGTGKVLTVDAGNLGSTDGSVDAYTKLNGPIGLSFRERQAETPTHLGFRTRTPSFLTFHLVAKDGSTLDSYDLLADVEPNPDEWSTMAAFNDSFYLVRVYRTGDGFTEIAELVRFIPGQTSPEVIFRREGFFFGLVGGVQIASNATYLYFSFPDDNGTVGLHRWDGHSSEPELYQDGNDFDQLVPPGSPIVGNGMNAIAQAFDAGTGTGGLYFLPGGDLPAEQFLPADIAASITSLHETGDRIFVPHSSGLLSYDRLAETLITVPTGTQFYTPTVYHTDDDGKVLFGTEENGFSLYETDGTLAGTREFTLDYFLPTADAVVEKSEAFIFVGKFGEPDERNQLYAIDNLTGRLSQVVFTGFSQNRVRDMSLVDGRLYFIGTDSVFGEEIHFVDLDDLVTISGTIYYDANGNGIKDGAEIGLPGRRLSVAETGAIFYTDETGRYRIQALANRMYTLELPDQQDCLEASSSLVVGVAEVSVENQDIGLTLNGTQPGLAIAISSAPVRCNTEVGFWITLTNSGCTLGPIDFSFTVPANTEFISGEALTLSDAGLVSGRTDDLVPGISQTVFLTLRMPDENFVGRTVALSVAGVMDGVTTTSTYSEILRCAVDPNDKLVSPSRQEPSNSNYTQLDERLFYTIRFQNTGNDTAQTVRISDQLDANLDWERLKPIAASHPYTLTVSNSGLANFLFEGIDLVDSLTNEPGSHGFVNFEIFPEGELPDFTQVRNTAEIFFDFNAPIITNTVANTIVEFLDEDMDSFPFYEECDDTNASINPAAVEISGNGIDEDCDGEDGAVAAVALLPGNVTIYPNPTVGRLQISYDLFTPLQATIYDARGRRVQSVRWSAVTTLDLSQEAPGMYTVKVVDVVSGRQSVRRVILQ